MAVAGLSPVLAELVAQDRWGRTQLTASSIALHRTAIIIASCAATDAESINGDVNSVCGGTAKPTHPYRDRWTDRETISRLIGPVWGQQPSQSLKTPLGPMSFRHTKFQVNPEICATLSVIALLIGNVWSSPANTPSAMQFHLRALDSHGHTCNLRIVMCETLTVAAHSSRRP